MKPLCLPLIALALVVGCQKKNDGETQTGSTLQGVVLEKLDTPDSSFLRVGTESGEVWAKVPTADLAEGTSVSIVRAQEVRGWESPKLQKTFDRLYIGSLEAPGMPSETPQGMSQAIRQMGDQAAPGASVPKLQKASGADGRTIEEVIANGPSLKDRTVSVRGQVVRATKGLKVPNVEGGTWIHIQDGSGDQALGTNDLTVATDEAVNVGDVLVFQGRVTMDDTGILGGRVIVQGAKRVKG